MNNRFKKQAMNRLSIVLDKKIMLQKKPTYSGTVEPLNPKYEDYKFTFAQVEYFSTKEIFSADAVNVLNTVKFIIRFRKDVTPDMRIKFDGDDYEIKGKPRPLDSTRMYMLIVAETREHE